MQLRARLQGRTAPTLEGMAALTTTQRAELRAHLLAERERTAALVASLARDFDDIVTSSADAVRDDEHDPEGATIAFERAQVAALLADARANLIALEQASARLDEPSAGVCTVCGGAIGIDRLRARPATQRCVRCV